MYVRDLQSGFQTCFAKIYQLRFNRQFCYSASAHVPNIFCSDKGRLSKLSKTTSMSIRSLIYFEQTLS